MLQQTQVERVVPRFGAFLARFPTATACADASAADVIGEWAGLGYNRRALNLHRCATAVRDRHAGQLPADLAELLALPGIGPYTARAVLAFAHEADVGVLDTNARRVLARQLGRQPTQVDADAVVPRGAGWAWNQAMLDLGATVCRARVPACDRCPVTVACAWHRQGRPEPDPGASRSKQSTFAGSDRQGRGRLVAALRRDAVAVGELAEVMGWPDDPDRAARVAATLVTDGLALVDDVGYRLPGRPSTHATRNVVPGRSRGRRTTATSS
jgi:A/G-specific adenine glycosylase